MNLFSILVSSLVLSTNNPINHNNSPNDFTSTYLPINQPFSPEKSPYDKQKQWAYHVSNDTRILIVEYSDGEDQFQKKALPGTKPRLISGYVHPNMNLRIPSPHVREDRFAKTKTQEA